MSQLQKGTTSLLAKVFRTVSGSFFITYIVSIPFLGILMFSSSFERNKLKTRQMRRISRFDHEVGMSLERKFIKGKRKDATQQVSINTRVVELKKGAKFLLGIAGTVSDVSFTMGQNQEQGSQYFPITSYRFAGYADFCSFFQAIFQSLMKR